MTTLRAGVVGLGAMGRRHVRVLRTLPGVDLVAAADPSPAARSAIGGATVGDLDELLALGIDLCVVAAPTTAHTEIGLRLAAAGVHALIEKPLAADVESGLLITDAFEARDLVGCVGHIERYNPALRAMRLQVSRGALGDTFQIATRRQGPFPERIRDVGVVMDLATHDIDLTCWVAGSSYRRVSAFAGRPGGRPHEDLVTVSGVLQDGTLTNHLVNWLSPVKERVVTLTGARGCLIADTLAGELWLQRNQAAAAGGPAASTICAASAADAVRCAVRKREPLQLELENFRDAVLGRPASIVALRQGLAAVAVAEAVIVAAGSEASVQPALIATSAHQAAVLAGAPVPIGSAPSASADAGVRPHYQPRRTFAAVPGGSG